MTRRLPGSRPISYVGGGLLAKAHLFLLVAAGLLSRLWGRRGLHRLAWLLGSPGFAKNHYVDIEMPYHYRLRIYLADGYWIRILFSDYEYEPEIAQVLQRWGTVPGACFIDCGANLGYWSLYVAKALKQATTVVAVEPAPHSFNRLLENRLLNDAQIRCVNSAVWSNDGDTLPFASDTEWHGSAHILAKGEQHPTLRQVSPVTTVTVDSLIDGTASYPLVILKLDVEGAEREALQGATRTLQRYDTLVIYEDHGKDEQCQVSAYLFDLGMVVFAIVAGRPQIYETVETVRLAKTNAYRGYNFFACARDSALMAKIWSS